MILSKWLSPHTPHEKHRNMNPPIATQNKSLHAEPNPAIVTSMTDTPNWFHATAEANFQAITLDENNVPFRSEIHVLQLGAFAGHASEWITTHLLTHPKSTLLDVDTWAGSPDESTHANLNFERIEAEYDERTEPWRQDDGAKIYKMKCTTHEFFTNFPIDPEYDFIYIDADHTAVAVLEDAIESHRVLKVGGILAFDDYTWANLDENGEAQPYLQPKLGIDAFCWVYRNKYEQLLCNHQMWLQKIAH